MVALLRLGAALCFATAWEGSAIRIDFSIEPKFLTVLLRTGGPASTDRLEGIRMTWARDLEEGALILLEQDAGCKTKYGDNHWKGLTCLEAKAHTRLMNRTDFTWLLVVDDDTFVFPGRLQETLHTMDPSKQEVYGVPGCGDCGNGVKSFCGGGGYILSHQSLLKMASLTEGPVTSQDSESFVENFMGQPMSEWCDVAFGCLAQERGLKAVGVNGLYGNPFSPEKEADTVRLREGGPPLVLHAVKDKAHMLRIFKESEKERERHIGKSSAYNVKESLKGFAKWSWAQLSHSIFP